HGAFAGKDPCAIAYRGPPVSRGRIAMGGSVVQDRCMDRPKHGGHFVAQALKAEGVQNLFTLSGGHIAPIYDGCVAESIRIVDFRHEQAAAHAADGWARVTLQPGVAAVTAGPGVT